jgi:hypothetical protein
MAFSAIHSISTRRPLGEDEEEVPQAVVKPVGAGAY